MRSLFLIGFIVIIESCKEKIISPVLKTIDQKKVETTSYMRMKATPELVVVGDFSGDGKSDTLTQIVYSNVSQKKLDSMPDPYYNEWDSLVQFGNKWDTHIYLTSGLDKFDTLDIGQGMGLYCLINLGQLINTQDIIVFVPQYYDFSNLNTCRIYALQEKHWEYLTGFSINEMAFTGKTDTIPIFRNIPGYLKKEKANWVFRNNDWDFMENKDDPAKFQNLKKYVLSQMIAK